MSNISTKMTEEGCTFVQQYILQMGPKKHKERGPTTSSKELYQLHRRT